jgi:hypothetical protein
MRHFAAAVLVSAAMLEMTCCAVADSNSIGVTVTSDRTSDDFKNPKDTKYELNGSHTFDSRLILGGSFQFNDTAFSDRTSQNLEGILGYRVPLGQAFSVIGSAGAGEHWRQNPGTAFPYYVLRIAGALDLNQHITWDIISFRYRNAFDPRDNYDTPQVATGLTYKFDADNSIGAKIMRNWRDGEPSSTGISIGYKRNF